MHYRWSLLLALLWLPASVAARSPTPPPCGAFITFPLAGATAVPATAAVTGSTNCPSSLPPPSFVDATGVPVPASVTVKGADFVIQPLAPLAANTAYRVAFPGRGGCGIDPGKVSFSTAAKPGFRQVEGGNGHEGGVAALAVHLTEPVLHPADLADGATLVSLTVDGFAPPAKLSASPNPTTKVIFIYKHLVQRPAATRKFRLRLHKGLRFASGVTLAEDVELVVIPADLRFGWFATGQPKVCEESVASGCQAGRAGDSSRALAVGGAVLLCWGWRRRARSAQA